jgi:hypothetical protein
LVGKPYRAVTPAVKTGQAHPRTSKFPDLDARVRDAVERYARAR